MVFGFWGGREEENGAGKMEGAGGTTRMGSRSSTRHGPASVFQGKVRRWRKSWTQVASPSPSASGSRILLYKWLPLAPPSNANGGKEVTTEETTPPKALRFLPVAVVQAQRKEEEERKAAVEAEALNQEESEQPQAMDTVDGSLHEDIPSNPSEVGFETFSIYLEVCIYVASNLMVSFVIFVADFYLKCSSYLQQLS